MPEKTAPTMTSEELPPTAKLPERVMVQRGSLTFELARALQVEEDLLAETAAG